VPDVPFWALRRIAYSIIGFVALGVVTYVELDAVGGLARWELIALAAVVALFGPGEIAVRTLGEWMGSVTYARCQHMEEPTKACIVGLAQLTSIPLTRIGITVFVVIRTRLHPWLGVQKRVVRVRLESNPAPTSVVWTKKKGILGQCWTERHDVGLDHPAHFASFMQCTKEQWKQAPESVKMHLTYNDFRQIREFGYVLACPMIDLTNGRYCGCFVVQVPGGMGPELNRTDALELIHSSAALTCAVLK